MWSKRPLASAFVVLALAAPVRAGDAAAEPGPFKPTWESLRQYRFPEWFRDAKLGLWAHWGPQCQPEQGDWYGSLMYHEAEPLHRWHTEHYGHPSKFGFKDVCNLWKAEHWDPERLIALYKRAGAKYFVSMANHHDNFDNWDSRFHEWNSVAVGPHKNIVGGWEAAARKAGLRFGVTVHASSVARFYEAAFGSDKEGPFKGVPYDGNLTKADGKGLWWEGLDPQKLYVRTIEAWFREEFTKRVEDLIDRYNVDLLYFDDWGMPLGDPVGLELASHLYNASARLHGGRTEGVFNIKSGNAPKGVSKVLVWDLESGASSRLEPYPWQNDLCIGNWHYNRSYYDQDQYLTAEQVIRVLADVVSKNGNLLLNIPMRGDGTIDDKEEAVLEGMARWIAMNGECIYGTRPWVAFGEGPTKEMPTGIYNSRKARFAPGDVRYTRKGNVLYAIAMAWPGKTLKLSGLGRLAQPGVEVKAVSMLGVKAPIAWKRTDKALVITMPAERPCEYAYAVRLELAGAAFGGGETRGEGASFTARFSAIGLGDSPASCEAAVVVDGKPAARKAFTAPTGDADTVEVGFEVPGEGRHRVAIKAAGAAIYSGEIVSPVLDLAGTWLFRKGDEPGWKEPVLDEAGWEKVDLPAYWEAHSGYTEDRVYGWYRKTVVVPASWKGRAIVLPLGKIDDSDVSYFNGTEIGHTGKMPPEYATGFDVARRYTVDPALIRYGQPNVIAVRVYDELGGGGMYEGLGLIEPVKGRRIP